MIGFPLTARPCDLAESCGISTRFHVLSLYHRQVAHALLTRPPLTCPAASRRIKQNKFVRLECVRHAASVHPEPGSNSLMFVCQALSRLPSCIRAIFLLFTCFWVSFILQKNFGVSIHLILSIKCCCLLLFNFQWALPPRRLSFDPLSLTACILYHIAPPLSIPFFNFF